MGYIEKQIGFYTDIGNSREYNEDSLVCFSNSRNISDVELVLGVADGMGEAGGGKEASSFITSELERLFKDQGQYKAFAESLETDPKNLPYIYKCAIESINRDLYEKRMKESQSLEMGSTFTGVLGYEMELYLAHVGDSRAYLIRQGKIAALTEDHVIGNKIEKVKKSEDKSKLPKYFHLLYRSMGYKPWLKTDYKILKVEPNDFYFFCTDGLYNYIDEKTIFLTLMNLEYDPKKSTETLVKLAKAKGSKDNISAAAVLYLNVMGLEMSKQEKTQML